MHIPRILIAAPASGSGKTAVTCALLAALKARGLRVRACKCGPDYIDPMFHREAAGVDSRNLDLFFSGKDGIRDELSRHGADADLVVAEGVMGYYDGRSVGTEEGSSYDVARTLEMPVLLVVNGRGAALSLAALVSGMAAFRPDSNIRGILLNRVSEMLYPRLKEMLEKELGRSGLDIPVLGYIPEDEAFRLESRHLGLVTPQELEGLKSQIRKGAQILSESVELERILEIAGQAPDLQDEGVQAVRPDHGVPSGSIRIGIAQDEAFCFYYRANLELLEELGCELVPFSPLRDRQLPADINGLLLGGGYPELYAEQLSENRKLREEIRRLIVEEDIPCLAECGGFMYLHEEMEDGGGNRYPMAGVIRGRTYPTGKLVRFGYINLQISEENGTYLHAGEGIRGHEFHYWDSTDSGTSCTAVKPDGKRSWSCIHAKGNLFAGYPHLYLPSMLEFARRFVRQCRIWEHRGCAGNEKKAGN